jgi:hypothetical protein
MRRRRWPALVLARRRLWRRTSLRLSPRPRGCHLAASGSSGRNRLADHTRCAGDHLPMTAACKSVGVKQRENFATVGSTRRAAPKSGSVSGAFGGADRRRRSTPHHSRPSCGRRTGHDAVAREPNASGSNEFVRVDGRGDAAATAISSGCPNKPNPVTSVSAWTSGSCPSCRRVELRRAGEHRGVACVGEHALFQCGI